jgi:Holliday junction resolvasome RuvABC endonuclease subunit
MNALAIDLGTTTGYALSVEGGDFFAGSWLLASPAVVTQAKRDRLDRRLDPRIPIFDQTLRRELPLFKVDWLFFEDVQFGKTLQQVQLWSSFRGVLWAAAAAYNVRVECCPVGTLKKFGSGFGGSDKNGMAYGLCKRDPDRFKLVGKKVKDCVTGQILDDNAVDALHLLKWGLELTRNWKRS